MNLLRRLGGTLLSDRLALLALLLAVLLVWMKGLDWGGYLVAPYDLDYLAGALQSMVPLCLLGLAQLFVIGSGRGGIDLSVGAIVSAAGMVLGLAVERAGWPLWLALPATLAAALALGAVNGVLVAYLRFPALIATLATHYAYSSIALVAAGSAPISGPAVRDLHGLTTGLDLPGPLPAVPRHVLTFLLPCVVLAWLLLNRTTYGRRLYAVGTNDVAAGFAALDVAAVRFRAYAISGLLAGVTAAVTVAQFASARPDAGTVGNGMALPAITVALLGGVVITGGVGRVGAVVLAALLVAWLNAGVLLAFEGSEGSRFQLFALGAVLVGAALLNTFTNRRLRRPSPSQHVRSDR